MILSIAYGTAGTGHVTPLLPTLPTPTGEGWSLTTARPVFRRRMYFEDRPAPVLSAPVESDSVVWEGIQGSAPSSARDYILRAIASGSRRKAGTRRSVDSEGNQTVSRVRGKEGLTLSREDANRLIFGGNLGRSEQHRNYLTSDGFRFDSWIHDIAVPDFHPDYYEWDGSTRGDIEREWHTVLEEVVSSCLSSKHARSLLIEQYRSQQAQQFEEVPF